MALNNTQYRRRPYSIQIYLSERELLHLDSLSSIHSGGRARKGRSAFVRAAIKRLFQDISDGRVVDVEAVVSEGESYDITPVQRTTKVRENVTTITTKHESPSMPGLVMGDTQYFRQEH